MKNREKAILALRVVTGLTVVVGCLGIVDGFIRPEGIPLFGIAVPTWVLGASVAYLGLRYWRQLPELERGMAAGGGFAWANFKTAGKEA